MELHLLATFILLLSAAVAVCGGKPRKECGNLICEQGENCSNCPSDCCVVEPVPPPVEAPVSAPLPYVYSECSAATGKAGIVCRTVADCGGVCEGGTEPGKACVLDGDCAPSTGNRNKRGSCNFAGSCEPATTTPNAFTSLAVGDVPYAQYEACHAEQEVAALDPADGHIFFVHLGDIKDGKNTAACDESLFLSISQIFENVPFPTFFVPGDNGFLDCTNGAVEAYGFWEEYLFPFYERPFSPGTSWPGGSLDGATVERGDGASAVAAGLEDTRSELFAFYLINSKALVVGTNTPGNPNGNDPTGPNKWSDTNGRSSLNRDNIRWTNYAFDKYKPSAVIVLGHVMSDSGGTNFEFIIGLTELAAMNPSVPFLVMNDSHCFAGTEIPFTSAHNIFAIKQDDTSAPITVSVNLGDYDPTNLGAVFGYDRGCWCHTDHRPTKDIFWTSGECKTKCDAQQLVCNDDSLNLSKGPLLYPNWCGGSSCPEGATCSY